MRVKDASKPGPAGFICSWLKYGLVMTGGVILVALIEYIPFFAGLGPGIDLVFTPLFGGPFISLLIVFIPQVIVFSFICTYAYRKTGTVYTGALYVSILAAWIVTGASSFI